MSSVAESSTQQKMEYDHFSSMPDEILLKILSPLPTIEVASTSLLSKRWRDLGMQNLSELNFEKPTAWFRVRNSDRTSAADHLAMVKRNFRNFVNQTLTMLDNISVDLHRFRLSLDWEASWGEEEEIDSQVDEWIGKAVLHNVQELNIALWESDEEDLFYHFYPGLLSSPSITTLKLSHCTLEGMGSIDLISLKTLCLNYVTMDNETMQHVVSTSLLLEELCLEHCELESLKGQHMNLRYLKVVYCYDLMEVDLRVPNVQTCEFLHNDAFNEIRINVADNWHGPEFRFRFTCLVTLSLSGNISNDMIQVLTTQCRRLENFSLHECTTLARLSIFSSKLRVFTLAACAALDKFEVDAPNLQSFKYEGKETVELTRMNTNCRVVVELNFTVQSFQYDKLKRFLDKFDHVKSVSLIGGSAPQCVLFPEDILENSLPPLYNLRQLKLETDRCTKASYRQILIGLLRLSVHLEDLIMRFSELIIYFKFQPEKAKDLEDMDDFPNLDFSLLPQDHLKRRLVEVGMKNMQGDRREKELVEFLCEDKAITGVSCTPSLKNWSWTA